MHTKTLVESKTFLAQVGYSKNILIILKEPGFLMMAMIKKRPMKNPAGNEKSPAEMHYDLVGSAII